MLESVAQFKLSDPKPEFSPTAAQLQAMEHKGSDLLISAGAGSGKTATLTDRIVNRICNDKMDISRMLVVTFTKDAAAELKSRITRKLSDKLKSDPANLHICSQIVRATSADISTIHSFCLKAIKPHFDKLSLDSDFRIGEDAELEILRHEAMHEIIERFYEAEELDPDFLLVSDCYSDYTDEGTLPSSLLDLYHNNLSSCADGLEMLKRSADQGVDFLETLYGQALLRRVTYAVNHFSPLVRSLYSDIIADEANKKYFDAFDELWRIFERLENALKNPTYMGIKAILANFQNKRIAGGRSKNAPTVDTELVSFVKSEACEELKKLRDDYFYSDTEAIASTINQNKKICLAIYKVLKEYEQEYRLKKQRYSLCDFNDLERYTLDLFYDKDGNITDIAKGISLQYDELYIDEYQDVNSIQDKIFKAIARNNRFMVGDIKQSIYSFRSAEPRLFSDYRDSFVPYDEPFAEPDSGRTVFMSDNFRCDPSVIKLTNHISDYMFLRSRGFSYVTGDRLENAKIQKGPFTPQNAELCIIDKSSIDEESHLNELDPQAEFVAQEIQRLLSGGALPNGNRIKPGDIAILLRKSSGCIDKYINALERYGINHEYVQEISFYEKPHILLLLCILNSIDNPSKDVYLAGAMHSHIFNFSLDELVKIRRTAHKDASLISALKGYFKEPSLKEKIKDFLAKLDKYRAEIKKLSAADSISYVLSETGYLASCNEAERQDVIKLYNVARGYEQGSYKGVYSFLRYIDNIASEKGAAETVTSDRDNSVKIVTMHKSKGLEYEVCFICDTEKQFSKKSYTSPILFHKELGICGYISRDGGIVKYDNLLRKCASLAIRDEGIEEALRLLYVAMTRARSKLYIVGSMTKQEEKRARFKKLSPYADEFDIYSASSHLDIILGACTEPLDFLDVRVVDAEDIFELGENNSQESSVDTDKVEGYKEILEKRFGFEYKYEHLSKIPSKLSISTLYPDILDDEENQRFSRPRSIDDIPSFILGKERMVTGAERGTATHVFLQFCDFENLKANGVECELSRLVDASFISKEVGDIINKEHIELFISSEMMREFLSAKRIIREFRFNVMLDAKEFSSEPMLINEKVLVQGVTDCIYENDKGELILVDYKTDKVTEENYISELTRKHKTQLTYYKKACEMMFERKVDKVLIYSVPLGKTVELE